VVIKLSLIINLLLYVMLMTGCVVVVMSSCHDKDTDRLWCIGLCQGVI